MQTKRGAAALEELQAIAQMRDKHGKFSDWWQVLEQFGLWSRRGTGVPHYTTPLGSRYVNDCMRERPRPVVTISDDMAMYLNRCLAYVGGLHRVGNVVFKVVFVRDVPLDFAYHNPSIKIAFRAQRLPRTYDTVRLTLEEFVERMRRKILSMKSGDF